jgi:hypothetical protein
MGRLLPQLACDTDELDSQVTNVYIAVTHLHAAGDLRISAGCHLPNRMCHRAIQNQPLMGGSKPATLRWDNSYHFSKSVQG